MTAASTPTRVTRAAEGADRQMTAALFEFVTVRCFTCPHAERAMTPQGAHDQMEQHYADKHAPLIARLTGQAIPPPRSNL